MTEELNENEVTEVTENEQAQIQAELERQEQLERLELERQQEIERQEAEEKAREQEIIEHENMLKSFPETTVFYDRIIETDTYKCLGSWTKSAYTADSLGFLDNHMDESELTFVPYNKELTSGVYYVKGHEKPESTIEELKAKKLAELSNITDKFEQNKCSEMYFTSSLGFRVNGDRRSVQNIESLITIGKPTRFKDYDNKLHPDFSVPVPDFSVEKLNILKLEIAENGENLYQQKFAYEYRIQTATTPEELNFDMVFEMSDFSA